MLENNCEDEEELLVLRIKALKSTPRVNIDVRISPDSDNGEEVYEKNGKIEEKELIGNDDESTHPENEELSIRDNDEELSVLDNDEELSVQDNDEELSVLDNDEELVLRDIALKSLRRASTDNVYAEEADSHLDVLDVKKYEKHTDTVKDSELLALREQALKTLLYKRVEKTETLMKKVM